MIHARRVFILAGLILLGPSVALSQGVKPAARFGVPADATLFPQSNPKELQLSLLKALGEKRIDYLLAHLVDPSYVDERITRVYEGRFEGQFEETRSKLENPPLKGEFEKILKEGKMEATAATAVLRLPALPEREIHFAFKGGKWYLLNRNSPERENPRRK
ncbi:MAG: hypothetical protein EXR99_16510 [Gemmataceae bacterium]|nr:hypothetical protein [Gemmataceae bacterium]